MTLKEPEPTRFSDVPRISKKTSNEVLKKWSTKHWESDSRRSVALDIINNGRELLLGSTVDWSLVLGSIIVVQEGGHGDYKRAGKAAIEVSGARFIGGLAGRAGWSMHDPQSVYLSGKYLARIAKLEDFKSTMTLAAVSYGQNTLPEAEFLMETIDLLLEHPDIRRHGYRITKVITSLHDGDIQGAYKIVSFLGEPVSKRGPDFSKTTTSSVLTPPKLGI